MKRRPIIKQEETVWPRTDPAEMVGFDPDTKRCEMNCGPSILDPRSAAERKFQCDECSTLPKDAQ